MKTLAAVVTCLLFAAPEGPKTFILKGGGHLRAEVIAVEGERVRLRIPIAGGQYLAWRRLDEFKPHCVYLILKEVAREDSSEDRVRLAKYASDHDLVYIAERELRQARQLAGDEGLEPELEREIAERGAAVLERLFREELGKGHVRKAKRLLSELMIRYPDTATTERKEQLLAEIDDAVDWIAAERLRATEAREAARLERRRESLLTPIVNRLEAAKKDGRAGLLTSKNFARAHGLFVRAIRRFDSVINDSERLIRRQSNDDVLVQALSELREQALAAVQDTLLDAASICLIRGQFNQALGHVNRILAVDSTNGDARAMRARIEIAANQYRIGY